MDKNAPIIRSLILKSLKIWIQFPNQVKFIALLIFTKSARDLMEVRALACWSRWETRKNDAVSFDIFILIISDFTNKVAELHLHSGEINNNALKLCFLLDFQAIHCRSAATLETLMK
jgi:hypothetical protein